MRRRKRATAPTTDRPASALVVVVAFAATVPLAAAGATGFADAAAPSVFARVDANDAGEPRALQTAIVSYSPADGAGDLRVDLIAAVHVGDRGYYAELNARFRDYDAVLYEMVAPSEAAVPKAGAGHPGVISGFQQRLRTALGLDFQLDEIDYTAANLVHADLSPAELRASMTERNESLYVYFWRAFYASVQQARRDPLGMRDLGLLTSLLFVRDEGALKTAVARELTRVDDMGSLLDGTDGSAIIAGRNRRAIDVLVEQTAAGASRVAIFYGVAHMPDFEQRLAAEFGLRPVATRWVDAWRLSNDEPASLRQGASKAP